MEGVTRTSMKPLLDLQRIDSGVDRLTHRRAHLPEQQELDEHQVRRDETATELTGRQTELDAVAREQTKLETEIEQIDTKVDHEQKRLYSGEVSSPRELSNIQAELDALRRRKTHLEDQELEVMEQRETLEAAVGELQKALEEISGAVADARVRRDAATVQIDAELAELGASRASLVRALDGELVEFYDDLRRKYGGIGVGALEGAVCKACSLPLSPAALDEIKHSDDPLIRCENCRRLLVIT